ncbi:MAG: AAA family ATPase [bacterium]
MSDGFLGDFVPPPPVDGGWARFERLDHRRAPEREAGFLLALREVAPTLSLDAAAVTLAAEVVALQGGLSALERVAAVMLVLTTMVDGAQGCTRTPVGGALGAGHLRGRFRALLAGVWVEGVAGERQAARLVEVAEALLGEALLGEALLGEGGRLDAIVGRGSDAFKPLLLLDGWLYHQRMLRAEVLLAGRIAARLAGGPVAVGESVGEDGLSAEQRAAVARAAVAPLTLVSGGPGTGKTSIVVALLRVVLRAGVAPDAIALAAPTGKAAWRMGAAIRAGLSQGAVDAAEAALVAAVPEPMTVHRLLGYSPGADRFRHHAGDPLDARVVVVDECSMIDVFLMERLAAALSPAARLVLIGDADQLPSVAAGAVFRDVLEALVSERVRLTHSYRMRADDPAGRAVLTVAGRINAGASLAELRAPVEGAAVWVEHASAATLTGEGVEHLPADGLGLKVFLEHLYRRRVRGDGALYALRARKWPASGGRVVAEVAGELSPLFAWLESARILCLTRAYDTGAERTNERLHAFAAQSQGRPADVRFLAGEPVMMQRNDYDRGLFNGDQGVVLWVEVAGEGSRPGRRQKAAVFPGVDGLTVHPLATLEAHLTHAYAMTVHKAQGSEYERVAIVLPADDLPLSSREMLYTGITRCRRGAVLVGDAARVAYAAAHPVTRFSGLAERLGAERRS